MPHAHAEETETGIRVSTPYWTVEHSRLAGGAWSSIVFTHGTGRNLLRSPVSSALRLVKPGSHTELTDFRECHEKAPRMRIERTTAGFPVVVCEGTFRDASGNAVPAGFRRRTEYHDYGLVWSTLELMSDSGCDDTVEVCAQELPLRSGLTDCFVRFHPTQAGGADLLGGRGWYDLTRAGTPFLSRYTPLQIICFERGREGIELFPGSELAQWDCGLKPDPGLGMYRITQASAGAAVELAPYCMAFRRMKLRLQGHVSFRLGFGLPYIKPRAQLCSTLILASADSRWPKDEAIAEAAQAGVKLIRFQNDYREDGPFWRAGQHPPYDAANMLELRRLVNTAHAQGLKIVPCVSLKELHPETPEYAKHAREWMHMAAPSLDIIHTWIGNGEFGGLMCLKSGWFDFRTSANETLLKDIPWDGLCLDGAAFHPCCHPGHARGPYHSDIEQFLEFVLQSRRRVGENGVLLLHLSGSPSIVAENAASLVCLTEDPPGEVLHPGQIHLHPQADFMPIAPRQLAKSLRPI